MRLKLTFKGPTFASGDVVIHTRVIADHEEADVAQRFFEMERTFNELTAGRLHVELSEDDDADPTTV